MCMYSLAERLKTTSHSDYDVFFISPSGQLYSRYSTYEWANSNHANFHLSDRERAMAERIRADAYRTVKATDTRTRNRQSSNTKKLSM